MYADDEYLCNTGRDCYIQTRGGSNPKLLKAVDDGEVVGMHHIERSITMASILWAPFTYYTSLFVYKAYPDNIEISIYPSMVERYSSGHGEKGAPFKTDNSDRGNSGGSVWEKPLLTP